MKQVSLAKSDALKLIQAHISSFISLTKEEVQYFNDLLRHRKIRKKQCLLLAGDVCNYETFIVRGCMRAYYIDDAGFEHVVMFSLEDGWIGDMYSFLTGRPATVNIDALEDSEVLQLEKTQLDELYQKVPSFERFFRIRCQNTFVTQQKRLIECMSLPAKERYISFTEKFPEIENRVPQHQVASFLGITPQFLSQIRGMKFKTK